MLEMTRVSVSVMFAAKLTIAPLMRSLLRSDGFDTVDSAEAQVVDPSVDIDPTAQALHEIASTDAEYWPAAHFVQKYVFEINRPAAHCGHETADEHESLNEAQLS